MHNSHLKSCHCFHRGGGGGGGGLKFSTYVLYNIYLVEHMMTLTCQTLMCLQTVLMNATIKLCKTCWLNIFIKKEKNGVITLIHCVCL